MQSKTSAVIKALEDIASLDQVTATTMSDPAIRGWAYAAAEIARTALEDQPPQTDDLDNRPRYSAKRMRDEVGKVRAERDAALYTIRKMRDRYEDWKPVSEQPHPSSHPHALIEFRCISEADEDADNPEYFSTRIWAEQPDDAVEWCAINSPAHIAADSTRSSNGGDHG